MQRNISLVFYCPLNKTIKNLESLTIERCYIRGSYNWPSLAERNYLLDPSVKISSSNNPFENITKNLKELTIRQSDPALFEYFNLLTWPKLSRLTVDVFMDSEFLRLNLSKNDQDFRNKFPALKKINLSLHDTKLSENLVNIIKTRFIKDLVIQLESIGK